MTAIQIVFIVVSLVVLVSAFMVVTAKNLIHVALWLVVTLFGVAGVFVLLEAGFLAVVQVVIYIGAIAILFIFAVMLTRRIMHDPNPQISSNWPLIAAVSLALFGGLSWVVLTWSGAQAVAPALGERNLVAELGFALVDPNQYVIPFEVASVLLLAAMIGAIMVAWDKN